MTEINGNIVKSIEVAWAEHLILKGKKLGSLDSKIENYEIYYEIINNKFVKIYFYPKSHRMKRLEAAKKFIYLNRHPYSESSFVIDMEKKSVQK